MVTAVIAQTKPAAKALAQSLGVETRWVFGAQSGPSFIGLRFDRAFIDASAVIPVKFMETIRRSAVKKAGARIWFVTADGDQSS